jgi:hypothetical protein
MAQVEPTEEPEPAISVREFLETVPPGQHKRLAASDIEKRYTSGSLPRPYLNLKFPQISLYCGQPPCARAQFFFPEKKDAQLGDFFVSFTCRNCGRTTKTFALRVVERGDADPDEVYVYKFGETPQFGPPLPAKLLQLAGDQIDLLKKGRRSENQSLGIGAFAYYRRVVEEQKPRLIDELKNAIERLGGNPKALAALESARSETQFSKALEIIADVTPKELFVGGQNPLKLLHGPLSVGLHGLSDDQCLTKAHSIRVVIAALLERVQMVTEEKAELDAAIRALLAPSPESSNEQ